MSLFTVNLNNSAQGLLDKQFDATHAGTQVATSKQRTVYIMGPGKINRKLKDGDTFQDCNYYKRFCYPQVSLEDAILTCTTDDGSVFSDVADENTFPYVGSIVCAGGSTYAANSLNLLTATGAGGYATFVQISNPGATAVSVKLNGVATAIFTLEPATSQIFNAGDLKVWKVECDNTASGAASITVEVLCSIQSPCNS
ncbi:MAG: hypothetical protein M0R80_08660 [Proteobacteria bacterium]|jgi:hypothetical protein|nr:hypothetical protein [Pseudomonadota bacterium]